MIRPSVSGQICHLDHDNGCSAPAALCVDRTLWYDTSLTRRELDRVAVNGQPRCPRYNNEQLIEPGFMRTNLPGRLEVKHVRMGFSRTGPEADRVRTFGPIPDDRFSSIRGESDYFRHRRSIARRHAITAQIGTYREGPETGPACGLTSSAPRWARLSGLRSPGSQATPPSSSVSDVTAINNHHRSRNLYTPDSNMATPQNRGNIRASTKPSAVQSMGSVFVGGEPVLSASRGQAEWQEAVRNLCPNKPHSPYLTFVVSSLRRRGHPFDLDNLVHPVLMVWDDPIDQVSARLHVGENPGLLIEDRPLDPTPEDCLHQIYLPVHSMESIRGRPEIPEIAEHSLADVHEGVGIRLDFDRSDIPIRKAWYGPIEAVIDDLVPWLGVYTSRELIADHRMRDLRITRGNAPSQNGVHISFWYVDDPLVPVLHGLI